MCLIMLILLRVATSESMIPRPCFQPLLHRLHSVLLLVTLLPFLLQIYETLFYYPYYPYFTISSPTSAPIQLIIVLGVLWTQETSSILIAGLFERDTFEPTPP